MTRTQQRSFPLGVSADGASRIPGVEVPDGQDRGLQHGVRRPAVPVEQPDALQHVAAGPMHADLFRKVPGEADVVVAEDDVDGETGGQ